MCAISDDCAVFLQEREDGIGLIEEDPFNFSQAMQSLNSLKWVDTLKDEMNLMDDNDVWDLVKLLEGKKPIGFKWIFKTKGIQRVTLRDIKFVLLQKALLKRKEGILKRLFLQFL